MMREQQEEFDYPQGYGNSPPLHMPSERADLLGKIKPTEIVDEMAHKLLGEIEFNGGWVKAPYLQSEALTELGAWKIATLMRPVSSQNVSLSNLSNNEIRGRTLGTIKALMEGMLYHWKEWGIKSTSQIGFIKEIVMSNTFITLKQNEKEGIRSLLKNTMSAEIMPPQEEQAGWSNIFRR